MGAGSAVSVPEPPFYELLQAAQGVVVVVASGEIDMSNASGFRKALDSALDTAPGVVVLDLSGVTFLDSVGVAEMVKARNRAVQMDSHICLVGPVRNVAKMLQVSGVDQVFAIHGSVREAIAAALE
jgi:anti-anti-sigma factor